MYIVWPRFRFLAFGLDNSSHLIDNVCKCDLSLQPSAPLKHFKNVYETKGFSYRSGPKAIKLFSCTTQLSMKFILLINVNMSTILGISHLLAGKITGFDDLNLKVPLIMAILVLKSILNFMLSLTSEPDLSEVYFKVITTCSCIDSMLFFH